LRFGSGTTRSEMEQEEEMEENGRMERKSNFLMQLRFQTASQ
jgi:hypothetical protein